MKIDTKCVGKIETFLKDLPQPSWMAVEAVSFIEWFIDRFRGCVDRIDIADATELAHRTKAGSVTLRWAICQATVTLCRSDGRQGAFRQRLIKHVRKPKANVAMGRRLLRILYAMMRDGTPYECIEPTNHQKQANEARRRKRTPRKKTTKGSTSPTPKQRADAFFAPSSLAGTRAKRATNAPGTLSSK